MTKQVEFFWDVGSPYTYLAATQLEDFEKRTGTPVLYRPFLLGGVFRSTGNTMPAAVPAKAQFMVRDLARWADQYGVKMAAFGTLPFPINTLVPMRVAMAADQAGQGRRFCHTIFHAYWAQGKDVSLLDELTKVIEGAGLNAEEMLREAKEVRVKNALRHSSDEAVARGAFGAPAFFVGDELFWGNDRMHQIEALLAAP